LTGLIYTYIILFGLAAGSFLNVCIYRLPEGKSIVRPRSRCPGCGKLIGALDNIPVLSFILLKGRCRHCSTRISLQYPLVELVTPLLLVLVYHSFGLTLEFFGYSLFALGLVVVFFTDVNRRIIPDKVTYPFIVLGLAYSALSGNMIGGLIGAASGFGLLVFVAWFGRLLFKKDAMGGGDVKLAAMVGAFLGWKLLLTSLFLAFVMGALFGGVFLIARGRSKGTEVAFGPFIAVGAIVSLFWGAEILAAYIGFVWR
jgi:leader peptidase (prepilin peptidase)/N-methyltransferase